MADIKTEGKEVISTYVSEALKDLIIKAARAKGQTVSGYLRHLIRQDLAKFKQSA